MVAFASRRQAIRQGAKNGAPEGLTGAVLQQRREIAAALGKTSHLGKQAIPKRPKFRHLTLMGIVFGTRGLASLKVASPKGPFGGSKLRP
jgi:hypothetical protein